MAIVPALRVLLALAVTFGVIPRIIFRAPKIATGYIDRFFIDMIRMTALIIVAVHVLVPLRMFQWTGLMLLFVLCIYFSRLRPSGWTLRRSIERCEPVVRTWLYLAEAVSREGTVEVKIGVSKWWRTQVRPRILRPVPLDGPGATRRTSRWTKVAALFFAVPLVYIMVGSLIIRIYHPLTHAAFSSSDTYVHLAWMKYLYQGHLYRDGFYPLGMDAFLASVAKMMPVAIPDMLRFAGPILNTLVVFLVYVIALRATRNPGASLIPAAVIGLSGATDQVGLTPFRQIGTLPQEFAALFAVIALLMALEYVAKPSRDRLAYFGMASFVVAISHPLGVGLVLITGCITGTAAAMRDRHLTSAFRVWFTTLAGTALAYASLPVALATGHRVYHAIETMPVKTGFDRTAAALTSIPMPSVTDQPIRMAALAGAAIGLVIGIGLLRKRDRRRVMAPTLAVILLAAVAAQAVSEQLLQRWYALRWTEFVWLVLPLGLALGLAPIARFRPHRHFALRTATAVAMGSLIVGAFVYKLPPVVASQSYPVEYEQEARLVNGIIGSNPKLTFTVVGPPAWYDEVLGSGYHIQLTDFADKLDLAQATDPGFALPIASNSIYIVVETRPFTFDALGANEGTDRYVSAKLRTRLMGEVDSWMKTYAKYHHDAKVIYENDELKLWYVKQEPDQSYAEAYRFASTR